MIEFKEYDLVKGNLRVTLEYIGEGVSGDYDDQDPEDEPLVRFSCDQKVDGRWEGLDNASYCTQLPVTISEEIKEKAAAAIMQELEGCAESSKKKALERMSWLGLSDFK